MNPRGAAPFRVAVVGAGVTGLTAAYRLAATAREARLPLEVTVFEWASRVGGKVLSEEVEGALLEAGPDALLTRKPWAVALCRELGLEGELVGLDTRAGRSFVVHRGKLVPLPLGFGGLTPRGVWELLGTPLFSLRGKIRLGLEWLVPPRRETGGESADESLASFVERRLGPEAVDWLAEPLLAGIYAGDARRLSLAATFPQLREAELRHGSLIRAARAGRKRQPARSQPAPPVFVTLRGGLARLPQALVQALGLGRVRLGQRVVSLGRAGRAYTLRVAGGDLERADAVLLAIPAGEAANLLAPLAPRAAGELAAIPYASVAVVGLVYPREAIRLPQPGSGFVVPRQEPYTITACTWASAKWPHVGGGRWTVLRAHLGRDGAPPPAGVPDERLVELAVGDLRRLLGAGGEPAAARVYRWEQGLPQYRPGHMERVERIEASLREAAPGVFAAGAALRGAGLPDCVYQGERAARAILAYLKEGEGEHGREEHLRVLPRLPGDTGLAEPVPG